MTVHLELADYLLFAEAVLGMPAELIADFNRIGLADSALAAPQAGFGGVEAYLDFETKVAVLCWHLVKNHPLRRESLRDRLIGHSRRPRRARDLNAAAMRRVHRAAPTPRDDHL